MPDRRNDATTRDRIDELRKELVAGMKLARRGILAAGLACVVAIVWANKLNGDRVDDINAQRARVLRDSCAAQNQRHDATIIELDRQLLISIDFKPTVPNLPAIPGAAVIAMLDRQLEQAANTAVGYRRQRAIQAVQTRAFTGLLVDALAPVRDCDAVVRRGLG